MRLLLDTHTFLWWLDDDRRLSTTARRVIEDSDNEVFVSAASGWEIAIKTQLGKLRLPAAPESFITEQLLHNGFKSLPISLSHALQVSMIPAFHRDPFDRILVVQSIVERMPIITADPLVTQYQAETIW